MNSLSSHLAAGADHGRLRFHPDCPRCRAERLSGPLADKGPPSRTQAGVLAAALGMGSLLPGAAAAQALPGPPAPVAPAPPPPVEETEAPSEHPAPPPLLEVLKEEELGEDEPAEDDPGDEPAVEPAPAPAAPTSPPEPAEPAEPAPEGTPAPAPAPAEPPPGAAQPGGSPAAPVTVAESDEAPAVHVKRERLRYTTVVRRSAAEPSVEPSPPATPAPTDPAPPAPVSGGQTGPVSEPALAPLDRRDESYVVRPGDSLWSIAKDRLGPDASAAQVAKEVNRLWELNKERIGTGEPDLLMVGTKLRLR